ncbi:MAG: hypothetical protein AB1772_06530 [Candidatus Zixiibacteriota bacterium]
MTPMLIAGTAIVNPALVFYTVGIIIEQRRHRVTTPVLTFLTLGVLFDITATACMIIGSTKSPFSLHGILGYSSLIAMAVETALVWRHRRGRREAEVPRGLHLYTRLAYTWWIFAYITGAILVMGRR